MSKFHSTFLTSDGLVYTCGHGIGGRLGLGGEEATLEPKLVELPDRCVALCCANDHSIFITQTSGVNATNSCELSSNYTASILGANLWPQYWKAAGSSTSYREIVSAKGHWLYEKFSRKKYICRLRCRRLSLRNLDQRVSVHFWPQCWSVGTFEAGWKPYFIPKARKRS